jgi:hypothetical protein
MGRLAGVTRAVPYWRRVSRGILCGNFVGVVMVMSGVAPGVKNVKCLVLVLWFRVGMLCVLYVLFCSGVRCGVVLRGAVSRRMVDASG